MLLVQQLNMKINIINFILYMGLGTIAVAFCGGC
jgi:hypothetical protein